MDQDGKVKISKETLRDLMQIAKDLGEVTRSYVSVSDVANLLLQQKISEVQRRSAPAATLEKQSALQRTPSLANAPVDSLIQEADLIAQQLQKTIPSLGPRHGSLEEQSFSPIFQERHAAHDVQENAVHPTMDSVENGPIAESSARGPAFQKDARPPGYYPGFPAGVLELAMNDPFVPPAPGPDYRPIYSVLTSEQGKRYISFTGWQPNVTKISGDVYVAQPDGTKKRVAYKSHRMFPDRIGKKTTIPGTRAVVSDGSDGDTGILEDL